jgi:DNA-binding response OmpR family regulator
MLQGTKKKILVVDDEDDIRKTLADYLSRNGYFVSTANSGKEGLKLAKGEHPDLVILDLMLPDIDGSDVAVELLANQQTRDIPIIFLTAIMTKAEQEEAGEFVANRCIVAKPCKPDEILTLIKNRIG